MNIVLLTQATPLPSRPSVGLYNIEQCRALNEAGHRASIVTCAPIVPRWLRKLTPQLSRHFRRPKSICLRGVTIHTARVPFAFTRTIRESVAPRWPGLVMRCFNRLTARAIDPELDLLQPDMIVAHGIMPWGDTARRLSRRHGATLIGIEHSLSDVRNIASCPALRVAYLKRARDFDRVLTVSSRMTDLLRESGVSNCATILNGITRVDTSPRLNSDPSRTFRVLCCGSFVERKGHQHLIEGIAEAGLRDIHVQIVGTPPDSVLEAVRRHSLSHCVAFIPEMHPGQLRQTMAQSDLFALPSRDEAFGLVYAEALSVGTPILLCEDAGILDLPHIRSSAWVVPFGDVPAIARALRSASAARRRQASGCTELVQSWILENMTWSQNAKTLLKLAEAETS